jgi:transcriptional regulator with XRE-family HTH domain
MTVVAFKPRQSDPPVAQNSTNIREGEAPPLQNIPIEAALTQPPMAASAMAAMLPPLSSEITEVDGMTFGQYLTKAREAKGLSLDDLAHLTKIRRAIIEALEHNARKDLPEKVFVLGYVRSYATAVGLNVEEAIQRCIAGWNDEAAEVAREQLSATKVSFAWVWPAMAAIGAAAAFWFIIHLQ